MSFAYFAVFPIAFGFFANYAPTGVQMMTDIDKYLSFVLTMFIAFGITFEVPVVVIVLVRLGVVKPGEAALDPRLRHRRRVRRRRDIHSARYPVAADAGGAAVAAVRAGLAGARASSPFPKRDERMRSARKSRPDKGFGARLGHARLRPLADDDVDVDRLLLAHHLEPGLTSRRERRDLREQRGDVVRRLCRRCS